MRCAFLSLVVVVPLMAGCSETLKELGLGSRDGGDAIMLSDNIELTRAPGGVWAASATGATANVIQAHPDTEAAFEQAGDGLLVFEGVAAWRSNQGLPAITLASSLQSATATFNGSGYPIDGLIGGPAFDATDTLTVTADDGGVERVVTVDAPPRLADPETVLGAPQGLQTQVRIPDGTFDLLYVFVVASAAAPGEHGLMRFVPAEQMTLESGDRVAPLLDQAAADALTDRNLTPTVVYFAYYREVESTAFFSDRAVPVQAGRMFHVSASALE